MLVKNKGPSLMKIVFLYFFQLMGVQADDEQTLTILYEFLEKKNSNTGKPKEMTKQ